MKRTTKAIMAFLTAMTMTAGAMGVTAYAEEKSAELTERQKEISAMIAKEQPYVDLSIPLSNFLYENCSKARLIENITNENGNLCCMVVYYYTDTDVKPMVENFLKENGYEVSRVSFYAAGEKDYKGEKINDPIEAFGILWKYWYDNKPNWIVNYSLSYPDKVVIKVDEDKTDDVVAVLNEKNIDNSVIKWSLQGTFNSKIDFRTFTPNLGDANDDGKTNVRDCACIANALANGEAESLPYQADYNEDTRKNVRDAAAISNDLANK